MKIAKAFGHYRNTTALRKRGAACVMVRKFAALPRRLCGFVPAFRQLRVGDCYHRWESGRRWTSDTVDCEQSANVL